MTRSHQSMPRRPEGYPKPKRQSPKPKSDKLRLNDGQVAHIRILTAADLVNVTAQGGPDGHIICADETQET